MDIIVEPLKLDIREIINNGINKIKKISKEISKEIKYIFEKETGFFEFFFDLFLSYPVMKIFIILIDIFIIASNYLSFKKITLFLYYTGLIIRNFIGFIFFFFKQVYYWIKFIRLHLIHKTMIFNREETLKEKIWNKTAKERGKNKIIKYKINKVWEDEDFSHPYLDETYFMYREYIKYTFFLLLHHYKYASELVWFEIQNFRIYYKTVSYLRRHSLKEELMKYADYLDQLAINFSIYKIFNMDTFVYYINIGINNFYENIKIIFQGFEEFHMDSKPEKGPFGDLEKRSAKYTDEDPGKSKDEWYLNEKDEMTWYENNLPYMNDKHEKINDPKNKDAIDITPKDEIKGPDDCSKNKIKNQKNKISYVSNEDLNKIGPNKPSDDPKNVIIDVSSDTSKKDEFEEPGDCPEKKLLDHSKKEEETENGDIVPHKKEDNNIVNILSEMDIEKPGDCTKIVSSNKPKMNYLELQILEMNKKLNDEILKIIPLNEVDEKILQSSRDKIKNLALYIKNREFPTHITKNGRVISKTPDELMEQKKRMDMEADEKLLKIIQICKDEIKDPNLFEENKKKELEDCAKNKSFKLPENYRSEETESILFPGKKVKDLTLEDFFKEKKKRLELQDIEMNKKKDEDANKKLDEEILKIVQSMENKIKDPEIFDQDEYTKEEILIREEKEKLLEDINFYLENYIPKNNNEEKIKNERKDIWYQILLKKQEIYLAYKPESNNKNFKYKEDINQYFKKYIPETPYEKFMKDNLPDEWREFLLKKQEYHKLLNNRKTYKLKKKVIKVPKKQILTSYDLFLKWAEGTNGLPRYDYEDEPNPDLFPNGKIPENFIDTLFDISFYYNNYLPKNDKEKKLKEGPYYLYEKFLIEKQKEDLSVPPGTLEINELGYHEDINMYIKHQTPRNILEKFLKENMQKHWLKILKNIQRTKGILYGKVKGKLY